MEDSLLESVGAKQYWNVNNSEDTKDAKESCWIEMKDRTLEGWIPFRKVCRLRNWWVHWRKKLALMQLNLQLFSKSFLQALTFLKTVENFGWKFFLFLLLSFDVTDKGTSEFFAYLFIIFFVFVPLVLKLKICLSKFESLPEIDEDLELGLNRSVSQTTLRVPDNGGVEWLIPGATCDWN